MRKVKKPCEIEISHEKWEETKQMIREGIKKKLDASKTLIENDKEVSAGLYICLRRIRKVIVT